MEIKNWTYDEFPEFQDPVEGASCISTDGNEIGVHYFNDVEYANIDGTALHLQILCPFTRNDPAPVLPCVVFVQGSAWKKQKPHLSLPMISGLAERGYIVAIVEYRHSGIASFPAQAIDARNAVRFMRLHAEEYHVDPENIAISGCSSGGHTALFAALRHNDDTAENLYPGVSAEVKAVLDYYGSISVMLPDSYPSTLNHHMPDSPEGMEMGGINLLEHPDFCRQMSVECNINPDTIIAPTFIIHGTKDRTVNTIQSVNLYHRMKECGKEVELYLLQGADHGGAEFWSPAVLDIVDRFLSSHLGDGGQNL